MSRLRPLLLAAALLLPALAPALAAPSPASAEAPARAQAGPEPEAPVVVEVTTLAPRAPRPGGRLQVAGTLTNTGRSPVEAVRVALRVGERLRSRSELAAATTDPVPTGRVASTVVTLDAPLAPGARTRFDLRTRVGALPLYGDGAYPLEVEVRGRIGAGSRGDVVGLASTFLPWFAAPPSGTTRLAFVWPLVAPPSQAPRRTASGPVLVDEGLAASLAPEGRLGRALRAVRGTATGQCDTAPRLPGGSPPDPPGPPCRSEPVPVTLALDGDLLDTVAGMAGGYGVLADGGRTVPGTGREAAAAWQRSVLDAVAPGAGSGGVLALPYADPDVVALTLPGSPLAADVGPAVQLGRARVAEVTGRTPVPGLSLAPAGPVTPDALEAYLGTGTRGLVVDEQALPPRPPLQPRTSGARDRLSTAAGDLTGLVTDAALSTLLTPDPAAPGWQGARLAEQRFLVETAMISAEEPGATRTLLVVPGRDAAVVPSVAAQSMLDSGRLPWLCPVAVAAVLAGQEQCPLGGPTGSADAARGAPVARPDDAPSLSAEQLTRVARARAEVDQLTGAVLAPSADASDTRSRLLKGALRAESRAWRDPARRRQGADLAGRLLDDVGDLLRRVSLLTSNVTLTSSRGDLSVNVQNRLDQAVTVRVRLSAGAAARLAVQGGGIETVPPRTSRQLDLRVEPLTSGKFPVRAQLLDRRGTAFGSTSDFVVRSTRYGAVALGVTGLAAAVLLVAAGVRLARRGLTPRAARQ